MPRASTPTELRRTFSTPQCWRKSATAVALTTPTGEPTPPLRLTILGAGTSLLTSLGCVVTIPGRAMPDRGASGMCRDPRHTRIDSVLLKRSSGHFLQSPANLHPPPFVVGRHLPPVSSSHPPCLTDLSPRHSHRLRESLSVSATPQPNQFRCTGGSHEPPQR